MAAAAGLVITFWLPQKHKGSFSLFIVKKQTQKTEDYKYDQFYAARTQEKLGEFAKQYLQSPEISAQILKKAGIEKIDYKSSRALRNAIRVYPVSAQEVRVVFKLQEKSKITKAANTIKNNLAQKIESLYPETETQYTVEQSETLQTPAGPFLKLNLGLGALAGFFGGILFIFFRHYLNKN